MLTHNKACVKKILNISLNIFVVYRLSYRHFGLLSGETPICYVIKIRTISGKAYSIFCFALLAVSQVIIKIENDST